VLVLLVFGLGGCVQQAVLENDVRSAIWKARTLSTASDLNIAHASLSAQLVELEALYQRDPSDVRVKTLLARGYTLMAQGFVELRRLEALASGDAARAAQEALLRNDAEARAGYYRARGGATPALSIEQQLAPAVAACAKHDRAAYEAQLNRLLSLAEPQPERRLEVALLRRLASMHLMPSVAARCQL
jgi:hypothetical protein